MPPNKVIKKKITKRKLVNAILDIQTQKLSFAQLKASLANLTTMIQGGEYELPTLAISSLKIDQVQSMLNLSFSFNNIEFQNQPPVDPSPICTEWMRITRNTFGNSESNEALTRITLNNLLVCSHHHITSHSDDTSNTVHLNAEANWSLWYGPKEDVAVSVVVVEAKSGATATSGVSQTLGYMGCVHRKRKELGKMDSTVYGVVSDGQYFVFLKINNDSQWCEYIVSARLNNYRQVLGLLVHIFRAAAVMSPIQSENTSVQTHSKESSGVSYLEFDEEKEEDAEEEI
ncbi:hypothetical protein PEX1_101350 [Penicillium expansum]|uniref:Uncharacterized protein n=1 Tax=Penicillium expansum TaxID=27334 RepID=A0A0A2J6E9_PENEN|nr:hypothetical protein PEX2_094430 [Penicillium expansum]KGO37473.1 hypothetical protein PEXP_004460 [Penicillium expansum]KGO50977.1 hypothetical protein PEX2_094430 [Penicillium expansum]KGO58684.1 hypothetical protein PEX1_101350 [Penicillium expansum]